jgi:phosphoribosylanthranilate isomerase
MWVKICGITSEADALVAVGMGADAVGFVFAPSPRQVTPGAVREIVRRLPPEIVTVGVFRDQSPEQVIDMALAAGVQAVQLHGHETPADARLIRPKVGALIVAFPAGSPSVERFDEYQADAMMLDAASPGAGEVFDWSLADSIPAARRWILAGGLTPDNVAAAVGSVKPWGVDVSSGVESAPGIKDPRRVRAFVRAARAAAAEVDRPAPDTASELFDWFEDA